MTASFSDLEPDGAARIVALFSVLIHAWQRNHFEKAANALQALKELGIEVRIPMSCLRARRRPVLFDFEDV